MDIASASSLGSEINCSTVKYSATYGKHRSSSKNGGDPIYEKPTQCIWFSTISEAIISMGERPIMH
jgi:hypothetical protein